MKIKYFFAALICTAFFACDNGNNPAPPVQKHLTYTVLYYNATLYQGDESAMLPYLMEVLSVGASDTVNFAAQVNFPLDLFTGDPIPAGTPKTQRFSAKKGTSTAFNFENLNNAHYKLYEPNTIANFIRWGTTRFPADRYILVMMGHGAVWDPAYDKNDGWAASSNDPVSYILPPDISLSGNEGVLEPDRASVFDNSFGSPPGFEPGISSFALAEGIKRAGKKIDMVYHHACLQNMLENLCELKDTDLVDYMLAAGHNTSSVGGDYGSLLKFLNTGADLERVISEYCYYNVKHMNETSQSELIFTDLRKLDPVLATIKKIVEVFNAIPDLNDMVTLPVKIDRETSGVYFYDAEINEYTKNPKGDPANWRSADINSYIQYMNSVLNFSAVSMGTPLSTYSTDLLKAINAAIVWGEDTSGIPIYTTFAVTVMPYTDYTTTTYGYSTYYPQTAFDKATLWSSWLKSTKNVATHIVNPPWPFEGQVKYDASSKYLMVMDKNITYGSIADPTKLTVGGTTLAATTHYTSVKVLNGSVVILLSDTGHALITVGTTKINIGTDFVITNKRSNEAKTGITIIAP
ncbi:hypothetical protein FACS189494_08580 [Spirochaetia bacterium]|nr:hypothetical protein FACS189494_08580 [Spirochaetia bacterium]